MKATELPSKEYLLLCFTYDQSSGVLLWNKRPRSHFKSLRSCNIWNARFPGKIAGYKSKNAGCTGYVQVRINDVLYHGHRIIALMIGMPITTRLSIDHIDGNGLNNRPENLRLASLIENGRNQRMPINNKSGIVGVRWDQRYEKWIAQISVSGKHISLGRFDNIEDAKHARFDADIKYGFHKLHGSIK